ncbi:MAG: GTP cyclohydrolase I FolE [Muribaculaceae bacterium]|nr:GTP cyclohydrolase I FolE [Muribaculaceae bacterium]
MAYINLDQQLVEQIAEHYKAIITLLGEDPNREGLVKTPIRAAKALLENTRGYNEDGGHYLRSAIFKHDDSQMVIVRDIEFYSLCEHHILPFFGTVSIGYIPDGEIVGLSKLGRVVDTCSRKLQVQERMTIELCELISRELKNKGVIVVARAQHLCMKMRGVEKQTAETVTMHYCGAFEDINTRQEFLELINK